ncbi:glycosyltransferase family 2 protein [Sphingomonas elodea]|uniref:glycosyltransferase family 2 protein n=1 Tax=Sphingomonas elodea TaxID=179878 RepID=UPI0002631E1F|nr:glycosyltransferase family 2 protein [Sphingomonas elodea]
MLSILLVCWNNATATKRCLHSLAGAAPDGAHEVVLVDNGSTDGTTAMVRRDFPWVRVVQSGSNLGFAAGANLAAAQAVGDMLLFLNNDAQVLPGAIDALLDFARTRPEAGLWGGRTLRDDGTINPTESIALPTLWGSICVGFGLSGALPGSRWFNPEGYGGWQRDTVRAVGALAGCFLLMPRDRFLSLGGFDERFFLYGEDVDLCIRARAAGARPCFTPRATIRHTGSASSRPEDMWTYLLSAKIELVRRYLGPVRGPLAAAAFVLGAGARAALFSAGSAFRPHLGGKAHLWRTVWRRRALWRAGAITRPLARSA